MPVGLSTRAGHEPSRAELDPSLALARSEAAGLGSARLAQPTSLVQAARLVLGVARLRPSRLVSQLLQSLCTYVYQYILHNLDSFAAIKLIFWKTNNLYC